MTLFSYKRQHLWSSSLYSSLAHGARMSRLGVLWNAIFLGILWGRVLEYEVFRSFVWFKTYWGTNYSGDFPCGIKLKPPSVGLSVDSGKGVREWERTTQLFNCKWILFQVLQLEIYPKTLTVDNRTISATNNCLNFCQHFYKTMSLARELHAKVIMFSYF